MPLKNHQSLLYKELSYQVQGAAIEVRKNFGSGLKETIYQNAFAEELQSRGYELGYFINFASPKLYIKRIIFTNDRKPFLKNFLVSIGLIFVLFGVSPLAEAAELKFSSSVHEVSVGQEFTVQIMVDVQNENINALEGKIYFPNQNLELKKINDGDSIVSLWLERPHKQQGEIRFSGIIPGGFQGVLGPYLGAKPGKLFSVTFLPKISGQYSLEPKEIVFLLNDGKGTPAGVSAMPFNFTVGETATSSAPTTKPKQNIPEEFQPIIASDPDIFNGRYFLVFSASDKETGIAGYAVHESQRMNKQIVTNAWVEAESPYLLKDQKLTSYVFVKAINKAGEERIASIAPRYPIKWYEAWRIWGIIILIIIIFSFIVIKRDLWKKLLPHQ